MFLINNLFAGIPGELAGEMYTPLVSDGIRIERIVSRGHASPPGFWYDQETDEWVLLVKGSAVLRFFDGREVPMAPGDHLLIPRHVCHRVERTDPDGETVWLAVHYRGEASLSAQR